MSSPDMALVTGAASGIGRSLASVLDSQGYHVVRVDVDSRGPGSVTGALSAPTVLTADVADPSAMQAIADAVGPVDLPCLNAGVLSTFSVPPWEAPAPEWERLFGVNVFGVANGLRAFVPRMIERGVPCRSSSSPLSPA